MKKKKTLAHSRQTHVGKRSVYHIAQIRQEILSPAVQIYRKGGGGGHFATTRRFNHGRHHIGHERRTHGATPCK